MTTDTGILNPDQIESEIVRYRNAIAQAASGNTLEAIELLLKVIDKQGRLVPLKLKPAQRAYFLNRTPADIILKAAQLGITTIVQAEFFIDAMVIPGIEVLILAQRDATATKLFEISNTFRMAFPEEMRPKLSRDNTHMIEFDHSAVAPGLKSTITVGSAEARTFGRGRPNHRLLCTEVGFYDDTALKVVAGIVARMPIDEDGNSVARRVEESTADGQSGYFYTEWNKAMNKVEGIEDEDTSLTPHFFPWWADPEYRIKFNPEHPYGGAITERTPHEEWLQSEYKLTDDHIRWRRWKTAELGGDMFKQEFPENPDEAFLPIGSAVFDVLKDLDNAQRMVKTPINPDYQNGFSLWSGPYLGRPYIIAVDQASGEGERDLNEKPLDFQAVTCWDAITLEQMFTFRSRDTTAKQLAIKIAKWAVEYNDALVVPERNLAQFGFFDWLYEMGVENLYIHVNERGITSPGYPNNIATKPALKDNFKDILGVDGGITIRSANLMREIRNYRWLHGAGKNRMGAAPGLHDDELITAFFATDPLVREQARIYSGRAKPVGAVGGYTDEFEVTW